jgi:hypothetical protein
VNKSAFRSQMPDEGQKVLVRYNPAKPQDAELGEKIEL